MCRDLKKGVFAMLNYRKLLALGIVILLRPSPQALRATWLIKSMLFYLCSLRQGYPSGLCAKLMSLSWSLVQTVTWTVLCGLVL
jgi:hypothetical protein